MVSSLKETVEKYIEEKFEFDDASIDFSESKVEMVVRKDEVEKGSFQIKSSGGGIAEGYLYTTNIRMVCEEKEFCGNEVTIHFLFNAAGLEDGCVIKGNFNVISSKGEGYLPFVITIARSFIETSLGQVKNTFHFANLAKSNWKEAVQLFYSPHFPPVLTGNESRYFNIYKGLAKDFLNQQNVEEFLIEIKKKQQIEYLPGTTEITLSDPVDVREETISITKNGWGYVSLSIFVEGDFLTIEKERLTEDEFLGNLCNLSIYIYADKLHEGNNYGKVHFQYAYGGFDVPVTVRRKSANRENHYFKEKELTLQLMNQYMEFRMNLVNISAWIAQTSETVGKLVHLYEHNPVYRLFQAQLLITRERYNEAKWVLDHAEEMILKGHYASEVICYYKYLTTLYVREEKYVNEQTAAIEQIYRQQSNHWRIAWLLLYLREEYSKNPSKKWTLLEEQFIQHNNSPVLYIEAVYLLNSNPSLLQKLEGFELQILHYAARKELLKAEVMPQIHYLMGHVKKYSKRLFFVLQYCYKRTEDTETLQEICELLIKGGKVAEHYFKWYALGVRHQLRITRLYEHFMLAIPSGYDEELPKIVMMYFAYNCNLNYEKKAFLYANIMRHADILPEMVRSYREQIEHFVAEQLQKGHINKDLAYLYTEFTTPMGIKEEIARPLVSLLFLEQVEVKDQTIKSIVVIHDKLKGEIRYPVINGKAMVAIYSTEYRIFLQDGSGNRYTGCELYKIENLFSPGKLARAMQELDLGFLGLDIYLCEVNSDYIVISEDNAAQFSRVVKAEQVRESYKREIRVKLLHYYFDNDLIRELDGYLEEMQAEGMLEEERADFIQFMVIRGMYDKALAWIKEFGVEGVADKTLLRLCSRVLIRSDFEENEFLLKLCNVSFCSNRYDEYILEYLTRFYQGTTKELRNLWRAAQNFDVCTQRISEKILLQMLYSNTFIGDGIEIFHSYSKGGADNQVKLAYLTYCAYEYFVEEKVFDAAIFDYLTEIVQEGIGIGTVCKLAYLKYFAEHKEERTSKEDIIIKNVLSDLLQDNIYFSFFLEFTPLYPQLEVMIDTTMLEYRTDTLSRVWLHYVFGCEGKAETAEYRKEEMKNMYGKIYVKPFLLFFGESIQYYITEEMNGYEELTESGTISKSDISRKPRENKFSIVNDLAIARTLQDYDTVWQLMQEFFKKEYLVDNLFQLL